MEFTRKNYLELFLNGQPVIASGRNSNRHTSLVEAGEHAEQHAREINAAGDYEVRIDGGLYYMVHIIDFTFQHDLDPENPPEPQAQFSLDDTAYSGNEGTDVQFFIDRTVRTDQTLTIDWAITNATTIPLSGTETFNPGDTQKNVIVAAQLIVTTENGDLTLSNPTYVSGPVAAPILGSPFTATFRVIDLDPPLTGDLFPRLAAGRIGDRDWGTGGPFTADPSEQNAMVQCHFSVINPQDIVGDSSKLGALEDWLDYVDANDPGDHLTYIYTDMTESGEGGADGAKLSSEVGPNGVLDWWVYENALAGSPVKFGTFGGSLHCNLSEWVTPDADGKIWPEWYADNTVQDKLDAVNTPGQIPRIHIYNDVSDHKVRDGVHDYNADGEDDNGDDDWNVLGTQGFESADQWRKGHRTYADRVRTNNHTTMSVIFNNAIWSGQYSGTNINNMFTGATATDPRGIHAHYADAVEGGWMEHLCTSNFPLCGMPIGRNDNEWVTGSLNEAAFGTWRLCMNAIMYLEHAIYGRKHQLCQWGTFLGSGGDDNDPRVGGNIDSTMMAHARWGLCSTLMTDAYHFCDNARTTHNMTMLFDEYGVVNTGTTGLTRGWLGDAVDDSMLVKELASGSSSVWLGVDDDGIFKREYTNGVVLVNSKNKLTDSITITVKSGANESAGELETGKWRLINGLQDPAVNTGAVVTSDLTINSADGRVLERV
jgi:hypothetical protein